MQIDIDTWFLESMFAHLKMAAHLVGSVGDAVVADELGQSIKEISRRIAELLGEPCGPQAAGEPADPPATREPAKDGESDELEFANMLDDLRESVARADAFTSAAEHLIREISAKEDRDRRLAQLAHLVGATADAMLEADDVGHVLAVKFAQRRRGYVSAP
jgi:hypothetical protein